MHSNSVLGLVAFVFGVTLLRHTILPTYTALPIYLVTYLLAYLHTLTAQSYRSLSYYIPLLPLIYIFLLFFLLSLVSLL
jgi:hypothetical protein